MKTKNKFILLLFLLLSIPVLLVTLIISLKIFYRTHFYPGTWINSLYVSGLTVEDAEKTLTELQNNETIILNYGEITSTFKLGDLNPNIDLSSYLNEILKDENNHFYLFQLFTKKYNINNYDDFYTEEMVKNALYNTTLYIQDQAMGSPDVKIVMTENGYVIDDSTIQRLNMDSLLDTVTTQIAFGNLIIDISECYEDITYTQNQLNTMELYTKVSEFQNFKMSFVFGDEYETLDPSIVSKWILTDGNGQFSQDEDGSLILDVTEVESYINTLAEKYNTYGKDHVIHATRGEDITISGDDYGNLFDVTTETNYLINAFYTKDESDRIPEYLETAYKQGADDIGDTYIEIDITNQTMYYYQLGICVLQTPIVTGNMMRNMATPSVVCQVYAKQKNRVLKGDTYSAFVKYWMPVLKNIGIHDASWRTDFGGDIYLTQGSHGCINTPSDIMAELFEMVEIGTPVLIFY